MTYDKEQTVRLLLNLERAVKQLQQATTEVKALVEHNLTEEQRVMLNACTQFVWADEFPTNPDAKSGDGSFWKFEKFLRQKL